MHRPGRLPPLNPLRVFEAAARHMSFTRAAADLGITQSAVSRQVKALEDELGVSLFVRDGNALQLVPGAGQYARVLTDAFRMISQATDSVVQVSEHKVITLQTYQTFMTRWLVPRLPEFYQRHPEIELRIITSNNDTYLSEINVDCMIHHGQSRGDEMQNTLLFRDRWCAVCSQSFLERHSHGGLDAIFAPQHLLHHHKRPGLWQSWLQGAGLPPHEARYDMIFNHHAIIMELARAGFGVALEQHAYVTTDFQNGRLIQPHPLILDSSGGYYLTWPKTSAGLEKVRIFRDWLLLKCAEQAEILSPARPEAAN